MLQQTTTSLVGLATGTWLVDPKAGRIAFAVKTMWGLVDVKGTFDRFEGALTVTDTGATGELVVHTDSLNTKHKKRDEHLRSADFFDARTHPRVTFAVTDVKPDAEGFIVSGHLAVGDSRTRVVLPTKIRSSAPDGVTIRAATVVSREDVGIKWNKLGMIKGDARLDVELYLHAPD